MLALMFGPLVEPRAVRVAPATYKQKFTNFAIANKAFKDNRKMDLGALAWVERSNKIVKETFA
jgi:hypothetical protein